MTEKALFKGVSIKYYECRITIKILVVNRFKPRLNRNRNRLSFQAVEIKEFSIPSAKINS